MDQRLKRHRAISRDTLAILTAVSAGRQTGSEIQSRIIEDTLGVYVKTSSLYAALHRLEEMLLVANHNSYYDLTDLGWQLLKTETQTLELLTTQAQQRIAKSGKIGKQ